jgi:uncharacterized membrane protein YgcG
MTTLTYDCEKVAEHAAEFIERRLNKADAAAIEAHLAHCEACSESFRYSRAVHGLISYVNAERTAPAAVLAAQVAVPEAAERTTVLERIGAAPWWFVSLALHTLVIALASLVSMAIEMPHNDDAVVMITELQQRQALQQEPEKEKTPPEQALLTQKETPATDPNSKEASDVVVPPDILAKAELGDHFETINLDKPDTHNAFGNEDAKMFHSVEGNAEAAGGGGMGGLGNDDLIGVGGAASKGSGGGWGGGNGTGIGVQEGGGRGSFGNRNGGGRKLMVKRNGGSPATESAVDRGLEWLAYHQEADGHWDCVKYGGIKADTSMTGLALLAFLGAGHTEKTGKYKENVKLAVDWIIAHQNAEGRVYNNDAGAVGYNHSMASMALAEAAGMSRIKRTLEAAQKAVNYSVDMHQCGDGSEKRGFRYNAKQEGDLSNSGWFIMQLKSAKVAGLHVPHGGFEGAEWFLDHVEIKDYVKGPAGRGAGYATGDEYDNDRHRYSYVDNTGSATARLTAIGCLCRVFLGTPATEVRGGILHSFKFGGIPSKDKVDMYYWYYETLCTFQHGGDLWKQWNEALKTALLPMQRNNGDEAGSFDPAGPYSEQWGRVGQTALSILCLEVYYRYLKLAADK